ncbi:molybdopterin-binding oxidoreductase [Haladaptatus sp. W1]|uniref:sulfite oxidase n=1 Tax=Haladaptatus sp. W1 TaxID=1897478 RepID=UPI000849A51E|nr:sulfite oxidase [Haladaptatus sp. W1]ODR83077.1 molybdopterin-binding oxidoreductase [Haladaptatus sp. W1]
MGESTGRDSRHGEIDDILERKPGTREARDEEDRYTVVGAASRETFADWLTPVEEHFVCHRNDIPDADAETWQVRVTGVDDGESLSMEALREDYPTVAVAHTMECAGNNRGQHDPETGSVQWTWDAVGTAMWSGTPVRAVLEDRGVDVNDDSDRWLTAVGGDVPADDDVYVKSIPLSKALDDCVLAYEMNGEPLPVEHGYPVRLIVPGWYGTNSVKWVEELRVTDTMVTDATFAEEDDGRTYTYWQHGAYRIHPADAEPEIEETVPTTDTWEQLVGGVTHPYTFDENVMSLIGEPDGERPVTPDADGRVEIRGVAWAGDDRVSRVEVSTDDGDTWHDADLYGPDYSGAWRLFSYAWEPKTEFDGTVTLLSRATDENGRTQPSRIAVLDDWAEVPEDVYPWNEGGYAANAYRPNGVEVRVTPRDE